MSWDSTFPVPLAKRSSTMRRRSAWMPSPCKVLLPTPTLRPLYSGGLWEPVIMTSPSTGSVAAAK